jgi:hypothetical protein
MARHTLPLARLTLGAVFLAALTALACDLPFSSPPATHTPTASLTATTVATGTSTTTPTTTALPSATQTPAASATTSQTGTPARTATPSATATITLTPTEAGVGATLPLVYKFLNNCTSDYGAWHISIFGPEEKVVDVPLGETVTGELAPGQYTLLYAADNGATDGPFGFFSDDGPVDETMCPVD